MDSHVAAMVQCIQGLTLRDPSLGGIGPDPLPVDSPYPYVTIRKVTGMELDSLNGRSGLCKTIMQVSSWDTDYENANSLREQLKDSLIGYTGIMGKSLSASSINHVMDTELYDGDRAVHQHITRYLVWWSAI